MVAGTRRVLDAVNVPVVGRERPRLASVRNSAVGASVSQQLPLGVERHVWHDLERCLSDAVLRIKPDDLLSSVGVHLEHVLAPRRCPIEERRTEILVDKSYDIATKEFARWGPICRHPQATPVEVSREDAQRHGKVVCSVGAWTENADLHTAASQLEHRWSLGRHTPSSRDTSIIDLSTSCRLQ
jgi:hypothetical protein